MSDLTEPERIRRWVETWKQAGPELDRVKEDELRQRSDQDFAKDTHEVLQMADHWLQLNPGFERHSGMVEQQRIFRKWWEPRMAKCRKLL